MTAFTPPISISLPPRHQTSFLTRIPQRRTNIRPTYRPRIPRISISACTPSFERGVRLSRQNVVSATRNGKPYRVRRWATYEDIDLEPRDDTRIDIWLVVQRDGNDYRVLARTKSELLRICDRCACEYTAHSDGRFDLVLCTDDGGAAEILEAVEQFGTGVVDVSLGDHVRDSVYLGVPTRSLCSKDCKGVPVEIAKESGSVRYEFDAPEEGLERTIGSDGDANNRLLELKKRLENKT